jgi:membrane protein DedA with SNARE-associated domain/rhodanese-related sulfurtransferase
MSDLVAQIGRHGLALVFANAMAERIGMPVPALPALFVAGALSATGEISLLPLLAIAVLTPLAIDLGWYLLGRWRGERAVRFICRISLSPEACVRQTEALFARRGLGSLLYSKFVPGYSIVVLPLAGAARVPLLSFLAWDSLGNLIWASSAVGLGYLFHDAVGRFLAAFRRLGLGAGIATAAALAVLVAMKWWERRRFYKLLRLARISVEELRRLIDGGNPPAIVDVRTGRSFAAQHIPGALRMTLQEIGERGERLAALPLDGEIVLYCNCPNEASAASVARALMNRGFTRVRPLAGGFDSWLAAGHPVEEDTVVELASPLRVGAL